MRAVINSVLSMVDFYLDNYSEERVLAMHADKINNQQKNEFPKNDL